MAATTAAVVPVTAAAEEVSVTLLTATVTTKALPPSLQLAAAESPTVPLAATESPNLPLAVAESLV